MPFIASVFLLFVHCLFASVVGLVLFSVSCVLFRSSCVSFGSTSLQGVLDRMCRFQPSWTCHVYVVLSLEEYAYEITFTSVVCRRMHLSALSGQPFLLGCALILRVTYAVCIFFSIMDLSFVAECCIFSLSVSCKRILSIAKVFVSSNSLHCRFLGFLLIFASI